MIAALGVAYLILGVIMLTSAYHTHRLSKPEFMAGLVTGISFGMAMTAFLAYITVRN
jgi:membrane-bound ClpP family serine protease